MYKKQMYTSHVQETDGGRAHKIDKSEASIFSGKTCNRYEKPDITEVHKKDEGEGNIVSEKTSSRVHSGFTKQLKKIKGGFCVQRSSKVNDPPWLYLPNYLLELQSDVEMQSGKGSQAPYSKWSLCLTEMHRQFLLLK